MSTRSAEKRKQEAESKDTEANKRARTAPASAHPVPELQKYRTNPEFLAAMIHARVEQLRLPENKVFVADRNDNIVDVWKGLVRHNFLSVPVLRDISSGERRWWGFVDINDIVHYVVEHFGDHQLGKNEQDFWDLVKADEAFQKKTVNEIMQFPGDKKSMHLFHPIKGGYSLYYAVESLAKEKHLHRLVVVNDDGVILNLVTQSHLIDFLLKNIDKIGDKIDKPVGEFYRHVIHSVREDDMAIEAFKMMTIQGISGVAIVDAEGRLKGNISNRDLKAISTDGSLFWRLYSKASLFREKVRRENKESDQPSPRGTVSVHREDTLGDVIKKLAEHNIHRVYVIDNERHPIGVISLRDVLLEIIS